MTKDLRIVRAEQIDQAIKVVRGRRVLLDSELARLYGLPADFAFRLTRQEFTALISQTVTTKKGRRGRLVFVPARRGRRPPADYKGGWRFVLAMKERHNPCKQANPL